MREASPSVSVIIPCYNPAKFLLEAVASARAQTYPVEIVLVDDGTADADSRDFLHRVASQVDRYIEQPNRGVSAARNTAIRAAAGDLIVPLDSDDALDARYVSTCVAALDANAAAGFVYTDYRVAGLRSYVESLPDYNLYSLLDRNSAPYAALYRKADWERVGGYDESMPGHEDWEFWLHLGAAGRFGHHVGSPLFTYRKHGPSLSDAALARHDQLVSYIQSKHHADLYSYTARAVIKARWQPVACFIGTGPTAPQSILDYEQIDSPDEQNQSRAPAFLLPGGTPDPHSAEYAALAIWSGRDRVELPFGAVAVSRKGIGSARNRGKKTLQDAGASAANWPPPLRTLSRHLSNAKLLSWESWFRHPFRSALRLVPLRAKETVNQAFGRRIFDLTFYLQFQTKSVILDERVISPLVYLPRPRARRRIAIVTPHLGAGGAEAVALEIASAVDRQRCEVLLIATRSSDDAWIARWRQLADHIYDLPRLCEPDRIPAALFSILTNWAVDDILLQNSLPAYSLVPHLKKRLPAVRILDIIHSVGDEFDMPAATAAVDSQIDLRIVVSEAGRRHLRRLGTPDERIRFIPNGVDLDRFRSAPARTAMPYRVLFAGRLEAVKRPMLLVDIAEALKGRLATRPFQMVVAGNGPELEPLRVRANRRGLRDVFVFLDYVPDLAPALADSDVLLLTSKNEGVPLVALEAMASARPVVAANVGAIGEILDQSSGVLVESAAGEAEADAFANAIAGLLLDAGQRNRLGGNARLRVEAHHNLVATRAAYRDLFGSGGE